jgi:hypothetical protein
VLSSESTSFLAELCFASYEKEPSWRVLAEMLPGVLK